MPLTCFRISEDRALGNKKNKKSDKIFKNKINFAKYFVFQVKVPFQLNNHDDELIESSQPTISEKGSTSSKEAKKSKKRHSLAGNGTGEVKRPMRRAAQKLNMSMSSISPASQENNPSKHVGKGNFLVFKINDLLIKSIVLIMR